jgi:hypothetical protein
MQTSLGKYFNRTAILWLSAGAMFGAERSAIAADSGAAAATLEKVTVRAVTKFDFDKGGKARRSGKNHRGPGQDERRELAR